MSNNFRKYPIYAKFYKIVETFEEKIKGKKDNEFINFELKKFITFRNDLLNQHSKMEDIICVYKKDIEKTKSFTRSFTRIESYKIKKSNKLEQKFKKRKRSRMMPMYEDLKKVIQCFDRKIRPFDGWRNSYKKIKSIREMHNNKEIKFKVETFKVQVNNLRSAINLINNHTQFLMYEYPKMGSKKYNSVEYIKKY